MSYSNHIELDETIDRYKIFLKKLYDRAMEVKTETINAAQEVSDYDEIRYHHFKIGIVGQFDTLKKKASTVFADQIKKKSNRNYLSSAEIFNDNSLLNYEQKINAAEELLNDFEEKINQLVEHIFNQVKSISPREKLAEILNEYELIKSKFCCEQCGAPLKLEQVYFVSTYVACEFCQTQNTFIPSMKLTLLPDLVREIASDETGILDYPIEGNSSFEKFQKFENHSRKQFMIKQELIPQLVQSYEAIYAREIYDFLEYEKPDKESLQDILNYYNANSIKKQFNSIDNMDLHQLKNCKRNVNLNQKIVEQKIFDFSPEKDSILKELSTLNDLILNKLNNNLKN